jgi:hypothetical protein
MWFVVACAGSAAAQPKICGNQPALGAWSLGSCPLLKDDGVAPDESAGDGIYTASAQLTATALLEYKILPTGMWDGSVEIRQIGTCPFDAGPKPNDNYNIQVPQPDVARPTLFFYDSRALADSSYSPAPGNRSGGDSVMIDAPAGSCPSFLAVGDFQNLYGPNATAAKLSPLGRGVLVGRVTAAKALAAGWRWKVMQQSTGVVREYGPSGWAYAPCSAAFATVSSTVAPGDSVYFLFHARSGRLQTLVTGSPLDGFSLDGGGECQPAPDMRIPTDLSPVDLALSPGADLQSPSSDDMGSTPRRPGIHCDCQIGGASRGSAWGPALMLLPILLMLRRRRAAKRFTPTADGC